MVLCTCYVDSMSQVFMMYLIFMTFHHTLHRVRETYISMVPGLWTFLCRTSDSCVKVRKLETSTPHCWCGEDVCMYSVHVCVSSVCAFRCLSTLTLPEDNLEWIICREASSIEAWLLNHFIHEPCVVAMTGDVDNVLRNGPQEGRSYTVPSFFISSSLNYAACSWELIIVLDSVSRIRVLLVWVKSWLGS